MLGTLALLAAACGSRTATPRRSGESEAIIRVAGRPIYRSDLDRLWRETRSSYRITHRRVPGRASEARRRLDRRLVALLVWRSILAGEAPRLHVRVTSKEVEAGVRQAQRSVFRGDRRAYLRDLERKGLSESDVRRSLRAQLVELNVYDALARRVHVTERDVRAAYLRRRARYRHGTERAIEFVTLSSRRRAQTLFASASHGFPKAYADQVQTAMVVRGRVPAGLAALVFRLPKGAVAAPRKLRGAWYVIRAAGPVVPPGTTPLRAVRAQLRASLLDQRGHRYVAAWRREAIARYARRIRCAAGFEPCPTRRDLERFVSRLP